MREINKIAEGLFEKVRDRFEDVSLGDENAKATQDPEKARFFNFDYVVDGANHGNITMSLIDERALKIYFSKNITDELDEHEKQHWYSFLRELREFAKRNLLSFEPRDITRSTLKHRDIQQQSKADATFDKDEVIGESRLYGTSKSSYEKFGPARIIVRHSKPVVDEATGARSRHINSIYVENHEGERFKLPFKSLTGARAMARHVSAGGVPHDDLGKHICEMAQECGKLKPFMNNVRRRTFEDAETQSMVEAAFEYHGLLNNTLKRMSGKKGYAHCKEQFTATSTSYIPEDDINLDEIKERFIKRVFNDKMTDALPLVHKAYKMKKDNKFTEQFENWATAVSEGTWAFPETDGDKQQLMDLLSQELPVGVDAQNATNALYNIFGDDELFDALQELAEVDPQADARDTVMDHLADKNPTLYQAILDEIGDEDTPEPAEGDEQEVAEAFEPKAVINGKQVDLSSIELDGVESWDRPDYADAYAAAAEFTDGTPLTDDELEELTEKYGDIINMKAHDMLESVASDAAEENAEPGKFNKKYGSGDGGMDGVVYEAKEECKYCGGECPNDEEHACDGYLGDIDDLYKDEVKEAMNPDAKVVYKLFGKISRHEDEGFEMLDSCPVWTQLWDATDGDVEAMLAKATPRQLAAMKNELTEVIQELFESKDKIKYDPKTGKLTGWEHEGDWKKTKGKDPVGKIHHMSDVARKRTEKLVKEPMKEDEEDDGSFEAIQSAIIRRIAHNHHELLMKLGPDGVLEAAREIAEFAAPVEEIGSSDVSGWVRQIERDAGIEQKDSDLHEAFERALQEAAINVGDIIRDKTQPEISGKVVGDMEENYTIQVDGEQYHIKKLNAEKVAKEAIELPDNPDYKPYDKPTFQRKGITPGQPNKTLPGINPADQREKQPWAGYNTDEPAYKRKAQYELEKEKLQKLKPANDPKLEDIMKLSGLLK